MAESYGYFDYGDVKDLIINYNPSQGFIIKPFEQKIKASKNISVYKNAQDKNEEETKNVKSLSKHILCHSPSINKSVNNHYNYIDINNISTNFTTENITTNQYKVYTPDVGFYEMTSVGQIARHDLTIIPTPSESIVKIYDVEQSSYNGYETEEVPYEVSLEGYASKNGNIVLLNDIEVNIELKLQVLLTVNVEQEDAVVIVNGVEGREHILGQGEEVTVEITCTNCKPYTNTFIIEEDTVLDVVLELNDVSIVFPGTTLPSSVTYSSSSFSNAGSYLHSSNTSHSTTGWAYLKFTTPNRATTLSVQAYTSSESNYDFGAVYVGTAIYHPGYSSIKSATTDGNGSYLYRGSGSNSSYSTYTMTLSANTTYYINLMYSKDGSGSTNSDRFYVRNITFTAKG